MSGTRHISGVLDPVAKPEVPDNTPVLDTSPLKPEDEVWYESGTGNRDIRLGMPVFCTEVMEVVFLTSVIDKDRAPDLHHQLLWERHKQGYDPLPLWVFTVRNTGVSPRDIPVTNFTVFPITPERYRLWGQIQHTNFGNTDIFALWRFLLPNPEAGMAVLKQLF